VPNFWVNGIVAVRDKQPYIQLSNEDGMIGQMTINEARQIAGDMMLMASRTEADAMLIRFFGQMEFGDEAAALLMNQFRDYRAQLDAVQIERPTDGETG
jgi:hypothetical protein